MISSWSIEDVWHPRNPRRHRLPGCPRRCHFSGAHERAHCGSPRSGALSGRPRSRHFLAIRDGVIPRVSRKSPLPGLSRALRAQEVQEVEPRFRLQEAAAPRTSKTTLFARRPGSFVRSTLTPSHVRRYPSCSSRDSGVAVRDTRDVRDFQGEIRGILGIRTPGSRDGSMGAGNPFWVP